MPRACAATVREWSAPMRRSVSAVSLLLLVPGARHSQNARSANFAGAPGGIHVGTPAIVSLVICGYREVLRSATTNRGQAVFAVVEPGVNAGRVSIGFGGAHGNPGYGMTAN